MHPPCPALDHDNFLLNELDGELCLTQFDSSQRIVIWMTSDAVNPQWYRRCILNLEPSLTISISHRGVLLVDLNRVFEYDLQSQKTEDVAHLDGLKYDGASSCTVEYEHQNLLQCLRQNSLFIYIIPFIESLVPIASAR